MNKKKKDMTQNLKYSGCCCFSLLVILLCKCTCKYCLRLNLKGN